MLEIILVIVKSNYILKQNELTLCLLASADNLNLQIVWTQMRLESLIWIQII